MSTPSTDQARWDAEFEMMRVAHRRAAHPRYWWWRWQLCRLLMRAPYCWPLRSAWQYARALCENELYEEMRSPFAFMLTPNEALDEDRQHWDG